MIRLYNQDCLEYLKETDQRYDAVFMDPPDNIGLGYEGFNDKWSNVDYYKFISELLFWGRMRSKVVWLSFNSKHWHLVAKACDSLNYNKRFFIWRFTFGQYNKNDCGNGYRPILRLSDPKWRPNVDKIKVKSKRQLLGDARAAGPRVPDDVWEFPRVVGNSKERRSWHPTQHPEKLIERMFLMSKSKPLFFDGFAGSGTSIRVCRKNNWDLDTTEISRYYCEKLREEHESINYSVTG